jgi:hypothetical protein
LQVVVKPCQGLQLPADVLKGDYPMLFTVGEPVKDYPTGNDRADATRVNALLESEYSKMP